MTLQEYLDKHDLRPLHFAQQIGCEPSIIYRILNGTRLPSLPTLQLIVQGTNGEVTADDFLPPQPEVVQ